MIYYPKIKSGYQNHCVKFPSDHTISLRIINEKQGYAVTEIHT